MVYYKVVCEEKDRRLPSKYFERCMAKSVSFNYLNRKGGTEEH